MELLSKKMYPVLQGIVLDINLILLLPAICFGFIYYRNIKYTNSSVNFSISSVDKTYSTNIFLAQIQKVFISQLNLILLIISMIIASALCYSNDILTSFIIYEILTVATIPLVCKSPKQFFYAYYLIFFSNVVLLPLILLLKAGVIPFSFYLMSILLVLGVVKTAIVPVHLWLLSAYKASYPVSATLHAAVLINSGSLFLIQLLENLLTFSKSDSAVMILVPVMILGVISSIYSSLRLLFVRNIKQILIYSTIANSSNHLFILCCYMVNGNFTNNALDALYGLLVMDSIAKFCIFVLFSSLKIEDVSDYKIKNYKYPLFPACLLIIYVFIDHYYEAKAIAQLQLDMLKISIQNELFTSGHPFKLVTEICNSDFISLIFNFSHLYILITIIYILWLWFRKQAVKL